MKGKKVDKMQFLLAVLLAAKIIVPVHEHTEEDVQIIAEAAWLENGSTGKTENENRQCLIATMAVIINRMENDDKWLHKKGEKTAYDVIMAPGQYALPTRNGIGHTFVPDWVVELAREVLNYGCNVPDYVLFQSTQSKLGTVWKIIDGEYFSTESGHYMEGKDLVIETNKQAYLQQCYEEFKKQMQKLSKQSTKYISKSLKKIRIKY